MLPRHHKLRSPQDFKRVIRRGTRAGSRTLVVHLSAAAHTEPDGVTSGGPRFGFVVSKAVGNAVTRHAVTRKLRHQCQALCDEGFFDTGDQVVVRALPAIAAADSRRIRADIKRAAAKARRRG